MEKQNQSSTDQGTDEQRPGQGVNGDTKPDSEDTLIANTKTLDTAHIVEKLRSIASAIEKDPTKLQEFIVAANPQQIAALRNSVPLTHLGENQLSLTWTDAGMIAFFLLTL